MSKEMKGAGFKHSTTSRQLTLTEEVELFIKPPSET